MSCYTGGAIMAITFEQKDVEPSISPEYQGPVSLLGDENFIRVSLHSKVDVDKVLSRGLPRAALNRLISNTGMLHNQDFLQAAIGLSARTSQRHNRPIDLLSTQTGTEQVENLLVQLEYCVYV